MFQGYTIVFSVIIQKLAELPVIPYKKSFDLYAGSWDSRCLKIRRYVNVCACLILLACLWSKDNLDLSGAVELFHSHSLCVFVAMCTHTHTHQNVLWKCIEIFLNKHLINILGTKVRTFCLFFLKETIVSLFNFICKIATSTSNALMELLLLLWLQQYSKHKSQ